MCLLRTSGVWNNVCSQFEAKSEGIPVVVVPFGKTLLPRVFCGPRINPLQGSVAEDFSFLCALPSVGIVPVESLPILTPTHVKGP